MARFFAYDEIVQGVIPTRESISALAEEILQLWGFRMHQGVIFGSVAWGEHTWRSDIDIVDWTQIGGSMVASSEVWELLKNKHGWDLGPRIYHHLVEVLGNENHKLGAYQYPQMSPSTRDHFRLLAKVKGGIWNEFYRQHIRCDVIPGRSRLTDIREYLQTIRRLWGCFQHGINSRECMNENDFHLLQSLENFPKQLMRKMLGKLRRLPCPDTFANVHTAFTQLDFPWVAALVAHFPPFFAIDGHYTQLVRSLTAGEVRLSEDEYHLTVAKMFVGLPVLAICEIVEATIN